MHIANIGRMNQAMTYGYFSLAPYATTKSDLSSIADKLKFKGLQCSSGLHDVLVHVYPRGYHLSQVSHGHTPEVWTLKSTTRRCPSPGPKFASRSFNKQNNLILSGDPRTPLQIKSGVLACLGPNTACLSGAPAKDLELGGVTRQTRIFVTGMAGIFESVSWQVDV